MNIYLFGNCQMTALNQMMLEQHPEWTVASCDVSTFTTIGDEQTSRHLRLAQAADVVVAHPMGEYRGEAKLSIETLRSTMRSSAQLITVPSIVFEGTHGAFTYLDGRLDGFFMPYHNCHVVDMSLRGYRWEDVCALLHDPGFYSAAFVASGIEASLNTLRSREELHDTTIKVSPMLDEWCRSAIVMNAINHPRRRLLAGVLNALYGAMSLPRSATEQGEDYLRFPFIPPLPTVLHHLGLDDDEPVFQVRDNAWTRQDYIRGSLSYYARLLRQDLLRCFAASRGHEFLAAFQAQPILSEQPADDLLPGTTEEFAQALVLNAFSILLERQAAPSEVDAHVASMRRTGMRHWLQAVTDSVEFKRRSGSLVH